MRRRAFSQLARVRIRARSQFALSHRRVNLWQLSQRSCRRHQAGPDSAFRDAFCPTDSLRLRVLPAAVADKGATPEGRLVANRAGFTDRF